MVLVICTKVKYVLRFSKISQNGTCGKQINLLGTSIKIMFRFLNETPRHPYTWCGTCGFKLPRGVVLEFLGVTSYFLKKRERESCVAKPSPSQTRWPLSLSLFLFFFIYIYDMAPKNIGITQRDTLLKNLIESWRRYQLGLFTYHMFHLWHFWKPRCLFDFGANHRYWKCI